MRSLSRPFNFSLSGRAGGQNNQSEPGGEANLGKTAAYTECTLLSGSNSHVDTQFLFGITFPTPATFFTTAGSPPFDPDILTPDNTNEPYLDVSVIRLIW